MMNAEEQIQQHVAHLLRLSPAKLRELLETYVEIDSKHTLTLREIFAQELISISRNPHVTKECRRRALRCAKQYLGDAAPELSLRDWKEER
jgi:hypothetical protein